MPVPGYSTWSVTAGEQPTTAYWNILGSNDAAFNTFLTNSPVAFSGSAATLNGNPVWQYLGYAQITSNFSTTSSTVVQITGLSVTVTVPTGATKVRVRLWATDLNNSSPGQYINASIWSGTVGSGTQIARAQHNVQQSQVIPEAVLPASSYSGSQTFNGGLTSAGGATALLEANTTYPAFLLVECC